MIDFTYFIILLFTTYVKHSRNGLASLKHYTNSFIIIIIIIIIIYYYLWT